MASGTILIFVLQSSVCGVSVNEHVSMYVISVAVVIDMYMCILPRPTFIFLRTTYFESSHAIYHRNYASSIFIPRNGGRLEG